MGRESRTRRKRAQEHGEGGAPGAGTTAAAPVRATSPEQLLAKHGASPIPGLPDAVEKFHLKIVTDVLAGHEGGEEAGGALRATRTWHAHHDGFAASRPGALNFGGAAKQLACAAGCNHCCRSPVGVVAAEAVLIADHIDRTFSAEQRRGLAQRMAERRAALVDRDPLRTYLLCPLNVDGQCTVYAVRPYNCRVFHSFDVDACERFFVEGDAEQRLPIDPVRRKYDKLIAASATVAFTALGLDMRMLDLMAALEVALAAGETRVRRFADGEPLFAALPTIAPPASAMPG